MRFNFLTSTTHVALFKDVTTVIVHKFSLIIETIGTMYVRTHKASDRAPHLNRIEPTKDKVPIAVMTYVRIEKFAYVPENADRSAVDVDGDFLQVGDDCDLITAVVRVLNLW